VRESPAEFMVIDAVSLRALEIERTMRTGDVQGSLLATLQRCRTPMGKRLLRAWLCYPLRDIRRIEQRQRAVGAIVADDAFAESLAEVLAQVQDVARIAGRLGTAQATPRDLVALGRSAGRLESIADLLDERPAFAGMLRHLRELQATLGPLAESITSACVEAPPSHLREGGLFRDGVDAALDEARLMQRDGAAFLARYQKELIDQTGIGNLKVGFTRVFGYYIELSRGQASKAPASFIRRQTLKNAERFPKLKDFEDKITSAEQRAIEREQHLFAQLCREASNHLRAICDYADLVAQLDVMVCFAENARRHRLVRPQLVEEPALNVVEGRHPVLDRILRDSFVPNDCVLGKRDEATERRSDGGEGEQRSMSRSESATLALITGPNMAGKSTYIRQVALIALLAHTGSFVPSHHRFGRSHLHAHRRPG
jgi:DNA mismatch repair protein MutS